MASTKCGCRNLRWFFNFSSWDPGEAEICRAFAAIQDEERTRIHKFVYQPDAKASLVGRLMYRKAVTALAKKDAKKVLLKRTERGRPYLENVDNRLEMNASHAGQLTVFAAHWIEEEREGQPLLGVDVMPLHDSRVHRVEDFFRLMRRQFTDQEWERIKLPESDEEKLAQFYRNWSLKESYVKAVGTGLNLDLQTINFVIRSQLSPEHITLDTKVEVKGDEENWRFEETVIGSHVVSVAVSNCFSCKTKAWEELSVNDLLPEDDALLRNPNPEDWIQFSEKEKMKPF